VGEDAGEGDIEVLFSSRHGLSPAWRGGAYRKGGRAQCRVACDTFGEDFGEDFGEEAAEVVVEQASEAEAEAAEAEAAEAEAAVAAAVAAEAEAAAAVKAEAGVDRDTVGGRRVLAAHAAVDGRRMLDGVASLTARMRTARVACCGSPPGPRASVPLPLPPPLESEDAPPLSHRIHRLAAMRGTLESISPSLPISPHVSLYGTLEAEYVCLYPT